MGHLQLELVDKQTAALTNEAPRLGLQLQQVTQKSNELEATVRKALCLKAAQIHREAAAASSTPIAPAAAKLKNLHGAAPPSREHALSLRVDWRTIAFTQTTYVRRLM